jgi:hypothetical protein
MLDLLGPEEILEQLDLIIESLTQFESCYECVDIATHLRDELADSLDM